MLSVSLEMFSLQTMLSLKTTSPLILFWFSKSYKKCCFQRSGFGHDDYIKFFL